jgi:hypothetical protein
MVYNLYLSDNTLTAFMVVNDTTIDGPGMAQDHTSINFIGRQQVGYGQAQDQSFLWLLENFSNGTPPVMPLVGQLWYDRTNDVLKEYTTSATWKMVGTPFLTAPSSPGVGNLWFNGSVLSTWTGSSWLAIGPSGSVAPASVYEQDYSTNTTTDGSTIELWKNGINGTRLAIPTNTTWLFEMQVVARRSDSGQEFAGWKISGVINNTSGNVAFASTPSIEALGALAAPATVLPWSVNVTADSGNTSLDIFVTGQAGKTINWTCVSEISKVS